MDVIKVKEIVVYEVDYQIECQIGEDVDPIERFADEDMPDEFMALVNDGWSLVAITADVLRRTVRANDRERDAEGPWMTTITVRFSRRFEQGGGS